MKNEERDLRWRTKVFSRRIIRLHSSLPRETVAQVLGKAGIAFRHFHWCQLSRGVPGTFQSEFISKTGDCLKEADETLYWLDLMQEEKNCQSTQAVCAPG